MRAQTVDHVTRLVGNPLLVHVFIGARQDPHHLAAARIDADRRAHRVHDVDRLGFVQLPRTRRKRVGLGGQRTNGAKIDHIALQLGRHRVFEIGGDLHIFAAADRTELRNTGNFGREPDATRAMDTARHDRLDQRTYVFVFDRALVLLIAGRIDAVGHGLILQVAFPALIANRTIERMIDQQELHHPFTRLFHHRRFGVEDFRRSVLVGRQILDAHGA